MIDVLYGPSALPADLDLAITELRTRLLLRDHRDHYGFLLAYIGHQLDRPELIRRGLNAMTRANQDHVFTDLLTRIWLPEVEIDLPPADLPKVDDEAEAVEIEGDVEPETPEAAEESGPIELVPLIEPDTPRS